MSPEYGGPGRAMRRPRKACLECRRMKVKCLAVADDSPTESVCQRCETFGTRCEYVARKRRADRTRKSPRSQPSIGSSISTLRSRVATKALSEDLGGRPMRSRTASGSLDDGTYVAGECLESLEVDLGSSISKTNEAVVPVTARPQTFEEHSPPTARPSDVSRPLAMSYGTSFPSQSTSSSWCQSEVPSFGNRRVDIDTSGPGAANREIHPVRQATTQLAIHPPSTGPSYRQPSSIPRTTQLLESGHPLPRPDFPYPLGTRPLSHDLVSRLNPISPQSESTTSNKGPRAGRADNRTADDAMYLGLVSPVEAEFLFENFMEKLSPLIGLFDPSYYTFDHVRNRSSALLSAICYAGSRFFLQSRTDKLWAHCRGILGRAVVESECTLEMVQMICVLVFWKKPTERNAWLDVGIAIRMAQRLDLKNTSGEPDRDTEGLPEDISWIQEKFVSFVLTKRKLDMLAGFVLFADTHLISISRVRWSQLMFGLPSMLHLDETKEIESWAIGTARYGLNSDFQLACSAAFRSALLTVRIAQSTISEQRNDPDPRSSIAMTSIQMAEQDILSHRARWLSPGPTSLLSHLTPSTMEICNMISACIWCDVKITRYNLWHEGEARLDVILAFQTLVRRTRTLADSKRLLYWSDGLSTMLAHLGVGVFKMIKDGTAEERNVIHESFAIINQICIELAAEHPGSPCMHIAQCYGHLASFLDRMRGESLSIGTSSGFTLEGFMTDDLGLFSNDLAFWQEAFNSGFWDSALLGPVDQT